MLMLRRAVLIAILLLCGGACGAAVVLLGVLGTDTTPEVRVQVDPPWPEDAPRAPVDAPSHPVPAVDRAIVISVDGLRPDLLLRADARNMRWLMRTGAYTFWAVTVPVAVTLPSHTSMLTGVRPERHGITWNGDSERQYPKVPTLFDVAHTAHLTTAMVAGKTKFSALARPGSLDWSSVRAASDEQVVNEAIAILRLHRPNVLFVHIPGVDSAGHGHGWGSPEQVDAVQRVDAQIGRLLDALDEQGLAASTFIIISADHGGMGNSHGGGDPRSRSIPWIAAGPGVRSNYDLTREPRLRVLTEDTFATVSMMLGLPLDPGIDGRPVVQILADRGELLREQAGTAAGAP
jgi:hypothetical protein